MKLKINYKQEAIQVQKELKARLLELNINNQGYSAEYVILQKALLELQNDWNLD
jgi:hypothetical protein